MYEKINVKQSLAGTVILILTIRMGQGISFVFFFYKRKKLVWPDKRY
jgi:uncharacterized protein YybS (DUF2232 family)